MKKLKGNNIFHVCTHLIILGCVFGILFGQGTHLHNFAFHLNGHLALHTSVHAHGQDGNHVNSHDYGTDKQENKHEHNVHTFDVDGVLVSSIKVANNLTAKQFSSSPIAAVIIYPIQKGPSSLFCLPPPDKPVHQNSALSFSLRGPPVV